ncbi:response regulator transcription factor [Paenibacillus paeoniae]|uniref:Heme response regulator HssR n=1 Tax=Paenibacillus paeoniae TaxID=2292705 RepID=A0A371P8T7_9BACL|nr:response regulator transcription factor [Paenibacillus paeoniae]REK71916.1 DNA-binding response regulator [Paenibacillus paeoniae]
MATILIAEDDAHIRELISEHMQSAGFITVEAGDGVEALDIVQNSEIDLIILDIMMPQMDGWELCKEIRSRGRDMPILMLTAKGETGQKVKGFQLGTDDYLTKPFDPAELVLRVKALLKRYRIAFSQLVQLGGIVLNRLTYKVMRGEEELTLPLKEFELLFKLACHPGQIFTREQLIVHIWGMAYEGDDRTVDVHIKRLRERFADESNGFRIETARGLGYRVVSQP